MIEKAIRLGEELTSYALRSRLRNLYSNQRFCEKKVIGSIGGATTSGFIVLQKNGKYRRTR